MYLVATYKVIDCVITDPETRELIVVETNHEITAFIEKLLLSLYDEQLTKIQIDLTNLEITITSKDIDSSVYYHRFYLIPLKKFKV